MRLAAVMLWMIVLSLCALPSPSAVAGELPDGRAYELVSPAEKSGNMAGVDRAGRPRYALAAPAMNAEEEPSILFGGSGPMGNGESGVAGLFVARRSPTGWSTRAALPRPEDAPGEGDEAVGLEPAANLSSVAFTSLRSYGLGNPESEPAGTSDGLYLTSAGGALQWLSKPLFSEPDPTPGHVGGALEIAGATPDLSTVYFTYYGTLLSEDLSRERVLSEHGGANAFDVDWGFYEWREGTLTNAARLPNGSFSPYGAVPAATANAAATAPQAYGNEVSADGSRAFFVSPDPQACAALAGGCGAERPQLYVRSGGVAALASFSEVLAPVDGHPAPAPDGVQPMAEPQLPTGSAAYAFASPDGSRVFFLSDDRLTSAAGGGGEYEYNVGSESLKYLPAVTGPILGSNASGSRFLFEDIASSPAKLQLSSEGRIVTVAPLPAPVTTSTNEGGSLLVGPVRMPGDGGLVIFQTDAPIAGFNDEGGFEQIYRYDAGTAALECVSCPPSGTAPSGDAILSGDDLPGVGAGHPLDSPGVSEDGEEVFFQTPDPLVAQDINGEQDVYEWRAGRVSLISPGTSPSASFLLGNDASGRDVFFATASGLVSEDTDGSYDVYDARVGGGFRGAEPASCVGFCGESSPPPALLGAVPVGSETFPAGENASAPAASPAPPPSRHAKPKKKKHRKRRAVRRRHRRRPLRQTVRCLAAGPPSVRCAHPARTPIPRYPS